MLTSPLRAGVLLGVSSCAFCTSCCEFIVTLPDCSWGQDGLGVIHCLWLLWTFPRLWYHIFNGKEKKEGRKKGREGWRDGGREGGRKRNRLVPQLERNLDLMWILSSWSRWRCRRAGTETGADLLRKLSPGRMASWQEPSIAQLSISRWRFFLRTSPSLLRSVLTTTVSARMLVTRSRV